MPEVAEPKKCFYCGDDLTDDNETNFCSPDCEEEYYEELTLEQEEEMEEEEEEEEE